MADGWFEHLVATGAQVHQCLADSGSDMSECGGQLRFAILSNGQCLSTAALQLLRTSGIWHILQLTKETIDKKPSFRCD